MSKYRTHVEVDGPAEFTLRNGPAKALVITFAKNRYKGRDRVVAWWYTDIWLGRRARLPFLKATATANVVAWFVLGWLT